MSYMVRLLFFLRRKKKKKFIDNHIITMLKDKINNRMSLNELYFH